MTRSFFAPQRGRIKDIPQCHLQRDDADEIGEDDNDHCLFGMLVDIPQYLAAAAHRSASVIECGLGRGMRANGLTRPHTPLKGRDAVASSSGVATSPRAMRFGYLLLCI